MLCPCALHSPVQAVAHVCEEPGSHGAAGAGAMVCEARAVARRSPPLRRVCVIAGLRPRDGERAPSAVKIVV